MREWMCVRRRSLSGSIRILRSQSNTIGQGSGRETQSRIHCNLTSEMGVNATFTSADRLRLCADVGIVYQQRTTLSK